MERGEGEGGERVKRCRDLRSIMVGTKYTGGFKNSIGSGEAKELMCMTHRHELRGDCWREEGYWPEGAKGANWDNCNNIINKIYLKNKIAIFR